jgi:large subunit ribosomal protein L25
LTLVVLELLAFVRKLAQRLTLQPVGVVRLVDPLVGVAWSGDMEKLVLSAEIREGRGKGPAHRLRAAGMIPAVCYGRKIKSVALEVDPASLQKILTTEYGPNLVFDVLIGKGESAVRHEVMLRGVQRDPVSRKILHIDLYCVEEDRKVVVRVPFRMDGKSIGVGQGGRLRQAAREVVVTCLPKHIPVVIPVDVTPLGSKDCRQISQVPLPEGCQFIYDNDFLVAEVIPPRAQ